MKIWFLAVRRREACSSVLPAFYKQLFFIPALFIFFFATAQTSLEFQPIPFTDPDLRSPGRGAEQWHNSQGSINYPTENEVQTPLDVYYRFTWNRLEGPGMNEYHWDYFDGLVRNAINKGQKLSFGIMTCYPYGSGSPGVAEYDNGNAAYPEYLHHLMQQESYPDWKSDGAGLTYGYGTWVPNWNSPHYLGRLRALHEALYDHINTTYHTAESGPHAGKTIAFRDVIFSIDIRGYGSWGEWHSGSIVNLIHNYPDGRRPTAETMKTIIDHHAEVFTQHPLSLMISVFDAEWLGNTLTPKEVGHYALQKTNEWGPFGWRRDNWGATDDYLDTYLRDNLNFFGNAGPFNNYITDRWKVSPVTGEPPGWTASLYGNCDYDDLERQVREYHATSVGNGNYGTYYLSDCAKENLRAAFKASGYRIVLEGGSVSHEIIAGQSFDIMLEWKNLGIAPTYESWNVNFELRDEHGGVAWSAASSFSPGRRPGQISLLPAEQSTPVTDKFLLPSSVPTGNYRLHLTIQDPTGYRAPLPLAIYGRQDDGSYLLTNISVTGSGTQTPPPVAGVPGGNDCTAIEATLVQTGGCDGEAVQLALSSANGTGPYDITVNGITYPGMNTGESFTIGGEQTIWSADPQANTDIDRSVELGVKFISSDTGYIKGIRFYSASVVAGNYTGHLWNADGELLVSADFGEVSPNGWQQVYFDQPVPVQPGKVYIASYYTTAGIYASTPQGLTDAVSNGQSLTALGNDVDGGNGVYTYNGPGFPNQTWFGSNYWVDVIFSTAQPLVRFTGITDSNGCTTTGNLQTFTLDLSSCSEETEEATGSVMARGQSTTIETKMPDNPTGYDLMQNYPNPFRGETIIGYSLPATGKVLLQVFDTNGRLHRVLVNEIKNAGQHNINISSGSLPAGIYYYQIRSGNYVAVKKMIVQ